MRLFNILIVMLAAVLFTACNQKELEQLSLGHRCHVEIKATYDYAWHLVYEDGPDWAIDWDEEEFMMKYESLLPVEPAGLRTLVYHSDDDYDMYNHPAGGGKIDVVEGRHSLLLYNNDTEYIVLNGIERAAEVTATTRSRSRSSYLGSPYVRGEANENTINPPDMLYACDGGEFEIYNDDEETLVLEYELRPLVYKYLIRYHVAEGIHNVALIRGALCGMASTVYLTNGYTPDNPATVLFDMELSDMRVTDPQIGEGMLYAVVNSFGAPDYPNEYYSRSDKTYGLNLEVKLTNGETHNFDFDITDQIKKQPRGGVINVYGVVIPEPQEEMSGSFEVEIEGWGPHQDIDFVY